MSDNTVVEINNKNCYETFSSWRCVSKKIHKNFVTFHNKLECDRDALASLNMMHCALRATRNQARPEYLCRSQCSRCEAWRYHSSLTKHSVNIPLIYNDDEAFFKRPAHCSAHCPRTPDARQSDHYQFL